MTSSAPDARLELRDDRASRHGLNPLVERSRSARRSCCAPRKLTTEKRELSFHGVALSLLSESLARALVGVPGK